MIEAIKRNATPAPVKNDMPAARQPRLLDQVRDRLWQEAQDLTNMQLRAMKHLMAEMQVMSDRQKIIITHMSEIDAAQAALLHNVALDKT